MCSSKLAPLQVATQDLPAKEVKPEIKRGVGWHEYRAATPVYATPVPKSRLGCWFVITLILSLAFSQNSLPDLLSRNEVHRGGLRALYG